MTASASSQSVTRFKIMIIYGTAPCLEKPPLAQRIVGTAYPTPIHYQPPPSFPHRSCLKLCAPLKSVHESVHAALLFITATAQETMSVWVIVRLNSLTCRCCPVVVGTKTVLKTIAL